MSEHPLALGEIVSWFRSKEPKLADFGVALAKVSERRDYVPAAAAHFDSADAIGQITAWTSGFFDFEVLRASDGKQVFFGHEEVANIESPALERTYLDFLRLMASPDGKPGTDETVPKTPPSPC